MNGKLTYFCRKLIILFQFLKVALLCVGAAYIIYWFIRFFNFSIADILQPVFDVALIPINALFETAVTSPDGKVTEYGYIAAGVFLGLLSFIFSVLEKITVQLERKSEIFEIARARAEEEAMNADLQKEYLNSILEYNYFSIYLRYKIRYANEILAQNNSLTIADIVERSYDDTAVYIHKYSPELGVRRNRASIFIRGTGFEDFDKNLSSILQAIKEVKLKNGKDAMITEFVIVIDAQKTEEDSSTSFQKMVKIAQNGYINKAVATSYFKTRFDLFRDESKFETEGLGFSVSKGQDEGDQLFLLKTKTRN